MVKVTSNSKQTGVREKTNSSKHMKPFELQIFPHYTLCRHLVIGLSVTYAPKQCALSEFMTLCSQLQHRTGPHSQFNCIPQRNGKTGIEKVRFYWRAGGKRTSLTDVYMEVEAVKRALDSVTTCHQAIRALGELYTHHPDHDFSR